MIKAWSNKSYETHLSRFDVLLGRGACPNEHVGNHVFRNEVEKKKEEYLVAPTREAQTYIAWQIVAAVEAKGERFLRKMEIDEIRALGRSERNLYEIVKDAATLVDKAQQDVFRYIHRKAAQEDCCGQSRDGTTEYTDDRDVESTNSQLPPPPSRELLPLKIPRRESESRESRAAHAVEASQSPDAAACHEEALSVPVEVHIRPPYLSTARHLLQATSDELLRSTLTPNAQSSFQTRQPISQLASLDRPMRPPQDIASNAVCPPDDITDMIDAASCLGLSSLAVRT
jgi:hypothetical protein